MVYKDDGWRIVWRLQEDELFVWDRDELAIHHYYEGSL